MNDLDEEYKEPKLSPEDLDDLWEIEKRVKAVNCYTDLLKEIDSKLIRHDKGEF